MFSKHMWLAGSILPSLTRLIRVADSLNTKINEVQSSEQLLLSEESYDWKRGNDTMHNVLKQLYTGERDNMDAHVGYEFEANRSFSISALGRAVNRKVNNGALSTSHQVHLWDCDSKKCIAQTTIDNHCIRDALGYAYNRLEKSVAISKGSKYR